MALRSRLDNAVSLRLLYLPPRRRSHGASPCLPLSRTQESGLTRTPEQTHLARNVRETLVKIDQIGRGASGVVHRALHVPSMRLVAVKEIPVFEQEKRRQMIKEVKALYSNLAAIDGALSRHGQPLCPTHAGQPSPRPFPCGPEDAAGPLGSPCPYNVSFYDAYIDPKESCVSIVVEYMDGGSLEDIVQTGGCAEESVLANISLRVLKGLHFIHARKQMHRDIKPSNLVRLSAPWGWVVCRVCAPYTMHALAQLINHVGDVKVSDFGIVRELEHSLEMANTFVGTLTYMSPERIAGEVRARTATGHKEAPLTPCYYVCIAAVVLALLRHLVLRHVHYDLRPGPLPHRDRRCALPAAGWNYCVSYTVVWFLTTHGLVVAQPGTGACCTPCATSRCRACRRTSSPPSSLTLSRAAWSETRGRAPPRRS